MLLSFFSSSFFWAASLMIFININFELAATNGGRILSRGRGLFPVHWQLKIAAESEGVFLEVVEGPAWPAW